MSSADLRSESNAHIMQFEDYMRPKLKTQTRKLLRFVDRDDKKYAALQGPFKVSPELKTTNYRWQMYFTKRRQKDATKKGFEIYCEMASIHGFVNFIGAKPWQRLFWSTILCFAICMTCWAINKSFLLDSKRPTVHYTEGITDPAWAIPMPALTICNLNKISESEALKVADKLSQHSLLPHQEILRLFRIALYGFQELNVTIEELLALETLLTKNNFTITNLLQEISIKCDSHHFKLCKYKGRHARCQPLLKEILTPLGICCSFNFWGYKNFGTYESVEHTTSCNYQTGLSILMSPNINNYNFSIYKFYGYEVYLHDAMDMPNELNSKLFISIGTEASIGITPRSTYGTSYLRSKNAQQRRCYLQGEYKLINFGYYSMNNCFAECRSRLMFEKCSCIPPFWPKLAKHWTYCQNASQITCALSNKDIFSKIFAETESIGYRKSRRQKLICNCLPLCSYNRYLSTLESTPLDRNFSPVDERLFRGIENLENYTLLHIFYEDLISEKFRLDVTESWLSFTGVIGGLAGLHMGFSFISILELVFFVVLRPLCNWFTEKSNR